MNFFLKHSGFFFGLCSAVSLGIMCFVPDDYYPIAGFIFFAICAIIFLLFSLSKYASKIFPITHYLLSYFYFLKKGNKDSEIIRWGRGVSTPLWLSHKYKVHNKIGEYIKDTITKKTEDKRKKSENKLLCQVYINNLGWTNVELFHFEDAEINIKEGIKLAKKLNDWCMLSKGYRHLLSLNIRNPNVDIKSKKTECEKYLQDALDVIKNVTDEKDKNELLAEYYYAKATYENLNNENENALNDIELAMRKYENTENENWKIKIIAREGEILLALHREEEAFGCFNAGKEQAEKENLKKPLVRNLIGLGKYYLLKSQVSNAQENFAKVKDNIDVARKIANKIGMKYENELIDKLEIELNKRK